jgi:hypothetical protein
VILNFNRPVEAERVPRDILVGGLICCAVLGATATTATELWVVGVSSLLLGEQLV